MGRMDWSHLSHGPALPSVLPELAVGEAKISPGPGTRAECQTPEWQEKAAACVAMDIQSHDQMLLFLALQCQFIGGILGTHRKGRKAPESGFCPGQVTVSTPGSG